MKKKICRAIAVVLIVICMAVNIPLGIRFFTYCPIVEEPETEINSEYLEEVGFNPLLEIAKEEIDSVEHFEVTEERIELVEAATEIEEAEIETETEEIEILETDIEETVANTTPKNEYTDDDLKRLSRLIYFEVGTESEKSKKYCGSVVLNRVASKDYPNTIKKVISQKKQYGVSSYYMTRKVDKELYAECEAIAKDLLENGSVLPSGVIGQAGYKTYKNNGKKLYEKIGKVYYFY